MKFDRLVLDILLKFEHGDLASGEAPNLDVAIYSLGKLKVFCREEEGLEVLVAILQGYLWI